MRVHKQKKNDWVNKWVSSWPAPPMGCVGIEGTSAGMGFTCAIRGDRGLDVTCAVGAVPFHGTTLHHGIRRGIQGAM